MTGLLHLLCDLGILLKAFDCECGHDSSLAELDVITVWAIARCNKNMLFCLCFHIQSPAMLPVSGTIPPWYVFHDHSFALSWMCRSRESCILKSECSSVVTMGLLCTAAFMHTITLQTWMDVLCITQTIRGTDGWSISSNAFSVHSLFAQKQPI